MSAYSAYTDQELAVLIKQGDKQAFTEIYYRYDKPLYLYAYHKLGNKEEARDIVHDVFAWMLNNGEAMELKTTLSGYLYRSTLNKIFNIFKHKQIVQKYIDEGLHYLDKEDEETDYLIREKDIAAMIAYAIAEMPERMRIIYELKHREYLSSKEIAERLEVSESTVKTQLQRAMKHLKLKLGIMVYLLFLVH
ncbi:RNA polymerase sigma-70 factor [Pedobacter frigoris]|uniref:RNA polymerase sigma factor n=1 Tax=Pedobacter frigoris TaxID=2571272 RepID=UPI002930B99A|nr:RNA polymerase sigma-70 factor [Pedobacter frigoris]